MQIITIKSSGDTLPIEEIRVRILQKLGDHATAHVTGMLTSDGS